MRPQCSAGVAHVCIALCARRRSCAVACCSLPAACVTTVSCYGHPLCRHSVGKLLAPLLAQLKHAHIKVYAIALELLAPADPHLRSLTCSPGSLQSRLHRYAIVPESLNADDVTHRIGKSVHSLVSVSDTMCATVQHAANMQRTNLQHTTCNVWHATCNLRAKGRRAARLRAERLCG